MKKILSIVFAVCIIASMAALPVFASPAGASLGAIPKTADKIAVDAVKEAVYDKGLKLTIDTRGPDSAHAAELDTDTTGTAYIVYSDGFLHVYGEVSDAYVVEADELKQISEPWSTDSFEVFVDYGNLAATALQYRIDANGYPSFQFPDENSYGADVSVNDGKFEWAAKLVSGGYEVEFKIPATLKAGDEIGFLLQINDMLDEFTRSCVYVKSSLEPDSWTSELYDYVTLSADTVTGEAAPAPVVEEAPAVVEEAAEVAPAEEAPVVTAAPETADASVIIVIAAIAALGCAVVAKKIRVR
jgi:3-oxoacyl-[acyl-carrier protein] reductase